MQDAFVRLIRSARAGDVSEVGIGWIITTTRRLFIDRIRSRQREDRRLRLVAQPDVAHNSMPALRRPAFLDALSERERVPIRRRSSSSAGRRPPRNLGASHRITVATSQTQSPKGSASMNDQWIDDLADDHGDPAPRAAFKAELRSELSAGWHTDGIARSGTPRNQARGTRIGWIVATAAATVLVIIGAISWTQEASTTVVSPTPETELDQDPSLPPTPTRVTNPEPDPSTSLDPNTSTTTTPTATPTTAATTAPTTPGSDDMLGAWPPPPEMVVPVADIARYAPSAPIPAAGSPVRGEAAGGRGSAPTFTQVFADADRNVLVTLQTQPGGIDITPEQMRTPLAIDGWDDAFLTEGALRIVAADPGGFVQLSGIGLDADRAAAVIETMERRPDGSAGWDLTGNDLGLIEVNGAWNDSAGQRSLTWFDGDRVVAQLLISPAATDLIDQALTPTFVLVDVNGRDAWLNSDEQRRSIVWKLDDDSVAVLAVTDASIDPLVIARSVVETTPDDYEAQTTTQFPAGVGDGCDANLFC